MRTATHAEDYPIHSVIPAQAGIHAALADICEAGLDSRLRGNDVVEHEAFLPESNSQEDSSNV